MTGDSRARPPSRPPSAGGAPLPAPSRRLLAWFAAYTRRELARRFHAVRLLTGAGPPEVEAAEGLVVYLAHPSWWDPMLGLLMATRYFPGRRHAAPIEAAAVAEYRFFLKIGFFPVAPGTAAGARRFLAVSGQVLDGPAGALWVTPGGRFADPRERPVPLARGLAHLARNRARNRARSRARGLREQGGGARPTVFVPLALEYPFWQERYPEALAAFGEPWRPAAVDAARPVAELATELGGRLEAVQDRLAAAAVARDPAAFTTLISGRAGVGGVYDLWRSLRARLAGERFRREHGG